MYHMHTYQFWKRRRSLTFVVTLQNLLFFLFLPAGYFPFMLVAIVGQSEQRVKSGLFLLLFCLSLSAFPAGAVAVVIVVVGRDFIPVRIAEWRLRESARWFERGTRNYSLYRRIRKSIRQRGPLRDHSNINCFSVSESIGMNADDILHTYVHHFPLRMSLCALRRLWWCNAVRSEGDYSWEKEEA